jgi:hypothetical protein
MTALTAGTVAVSARKRECVIAVGFELARLASAADECVATVGTAGAVGAGGLPVGSLTL